MTIPDASGGLNGAGDAAGAGGAASAVRPSTAPPVPRHGAKRLALRLLEFTGWSLLFILLSAVLSALLLRVTGIEPPKRSAGSPLAVGIDDPAVAVAEALALVAALAATWIVARRDRLSWATVGLPARRVVSGLVLGLFTGLASFTLVPTVARSFGWATIARPDGAAEPASSLAIAFPLVLAAGAVEEVLLRGLPFVLLAARGTPLAVLATSLVFAALHMANPGAGALAALGVFTPGIVLALARIRTGALWVPIGWHAGWNLGQGGLFGTAVSGMEAARAPLLVTRLHGPEWAVGGRFGPESGLLAVGADLLTLATFLVLVRPRPAEGPAAETPGALAAPAPGPRTQDEPPPA